MRSALMSQARIQPIRIQARAVEGTPDDAVEHCKAEWTRAYELAKAKGLQTAKGLRMASVAFKLAMPNMDSRGNIRAAIACIAQGIALEVFDGRDGSQLLYAAQVAISLNQDKEERCKTKTEPKRSRS